jgi:2-oxoglutarate dehydrogenase E1 component
MSNSSALDRFTYLRSGNLEYIEETLERYLQNPDSVDESWRALFEGIELGAEGFLPHQNGYAQPTPTAISQSGSTSPSQGMLGVDWQSEVRVAELILAYREYGRLLAQINPLTPAPSSHPTLELSRFGLSASDGGRSFQVGKWLGLGPATLNQILARLKQAYCGSIAVETAIVTDPTERAWLVERFESGAMSATLPPEIQTYLLGRLTETEAFERFLHTRYVAQKRFSVEGGDSIIPTLDCIIESGADQGVQEFVIGMAHRGRLAALHNVLKFPAETTLTQFEGKYTADTSKGEGDVKYHMGFSSDITTRTGKPVHLALAFNPSHLEIVNPVVLGMVRAKQEVRKDQSRSLVVPIVVHGDAAFSGQGVCFESLNFMSLEGYATGGTLHIILNNQVGFTTSPKDSRSTPYASDLARVLGVPILHVNGDDAEAVWRAAKLAMEYRLRFKKDVFIDLVCYRRHGHNEGDEPAFTQPLMYKQIKTHPTPREIYAKKLQAAGVVNETQVTALLDLATQGLTDAQARTRASNPTPQVSSLEGRWKGLKSGLPEDWFHPVKTAIDATALKDLATQLNSPPSSFHVHPKLQRFLEGRLKAVQTGKGIDWGNGEALAFASLLSEGHSVRVSGQDAERGTFTHRHSVLNDFETGERFSPFSHLKGNSARYQVHNSHLSELGVMGFEFGYSLADPHALTIWEAQFGDFANGAQIVIDQFLSASESKWRRMSGLTLLLPHGYEGQGPEHSSARFERFLQLSGRGNWAVCNLTTPAQLFHALRRQVKRDFRKPLVILSPKSLLRHPSAISDLEEFTQGGFKEVIEDHEVEAAAVKKVLLCTGKIYYDLHQERAQRKRQDVAIVRMEQLYPWPKQLLAQVLNQLGQAKDLVWVQEEPRNMGAWTHVFAHWMGGLDDFSREVQGRAIRYVGRETAASPAVGSSKVHEKEQRALIEKAFESQ